MSRHVGKSWMGTQEHTLLLSSAPSPEKGKEIPQRYPGEASHTLGPEVFFRVECIKYAGL